MEQTLVEYGLSLPNGTVSWGEYRGHPVQTPEQRWTRQQILRTTAAEIGFEQEEFLSCYGWAARTVTTVISDERSWVIDSPEVCTAPVDSELS